MVKVIDHNPRSRGNSQKEKNISGCTLRAYTKVRSSEKQTRIGNLSEGFSSVYVCHWTRSL